MRPPTALTIAFGLGVMAWIVVQVFFVPFNFLQPLVFVLGLALVLIAWSREVTRRSAQLPN
ncbi:MAG: hypothetical protein V9E82_00990 [Candidatus Nanopelagicales bacterium]